MSEYLRGNKEKRQKEVNVHRLLQSRLKGRSENNKGIKGWNVKCQSTEGC